MSAFDDWYTDDIEDWSSMADANEVAEKAFNAGMKRAAEIIVAIGRDNPYIDAIRNEIEKGD